MFYYSIVITDYLSDNARKVCTKLCIVINDAKSLEFPRQHFFDGWDLIDNASSTFIKGLKRVGELLDRL